jgi:hypothetical protein
MRKAIPGETIARIGDEEYQFFPIRLGLAQPAAAGAPGKPQVKNAIPCVFGGMMRLFRLAGDAALSNRS